jgi:hypothetical protein
MVKKFVIPPPLFQPKKAVPLDLQKDSDREQLLDAVRQAKVPVIFGEVRARLLPYLEHKVVKIRPDASGTTDPTGKYRSAPEMAQLLVETITFCYVGRRVGAFALRLKDHEVNIFRRIETTTNEAIDRHHGRPR